MGLNRYLQFSLRSLLIAVTLCALFLGIRYSARARERDAIDRLKEAGANVSFLIYEDGVAHATHDPLRAAGWLRRGFDSVWPASYPVLVWVMTDEMDDAVWGEMPLIRHMEDLGAQWAAISESG